MLVVLQVALCCALQTTAAFQPGAATAFAPALRPVALRAETAQCPSIRARAAAPPMALQMQTGGATLQKPAVVVTPQTTEAPQTGKPFHVLLFNDVSGERDAGNPCCSFLLFLGLLRPAPFVGFGRYRCLRNCWGGYCDK